MMEWALYCRVSTSEQDPLNQEIALRRYANAMGWNYEVYHEKESTRGTRPIKQDILSKLRRREIAGVIVVSLDRWGRSMQELVNELNEFAEKNISFISINENVDLSTPTGRLHAHILSAFADFERAKIRERTLAGLERAKQQGRKGGRPQGKKDSRPRSRGGYMGNKNGCKKSPPVKNGITEGKKLPATQVKKSTDYCQLCRWHKDRCKCKSGPMLLTQAQVDAYNNRNMEVMESGPE